MGQPKYKDSHLDAAKVDKNPANRDPITKAPGAHPVGTAAGAAAGGAAGAAVGTAVGGPVGTAVGAVVGAVGGGLAGKAAGEAVNPSVEDAYWRDSYSTQPYYKSGLSYDDDYAPAYRLGYEGPGRYAGRKYDEVETKLEGEWDRVKGKSKLAWADAKHATRSAWDRVSGRR